MRSWHKGMGAPNTRSKARPRAFARIAQFLAVRQRVGAGTRSSTYVCQLERGPVKCWCLYTRARHDEKKKCENRVHRAKTNGFPFLLCRTSFLVIFFDRSLSGGRAALELARLYLHIYRE